MSSMKPSHREKPKPQDRRSRSNWIAFHCRMSTANGNGVDLKADGNLADGMRADLTCRPVASAREGLTLTGTAVAHASLTGTIEHPALDGTIDTSNATVRTPQMTEAVAFTASVSFDQNQFDIRSMRAEIAGGQSIFRATECFKAPPPGVSCDRHSSRSSSSPIGRFREPSLPMERHHLTGPSLQGASGEVSVSQFESSCPRHRDPPGRTGSLSLKNDTITIDSFHIEGADTNAVDSGKRRHCSPAL